MKNERKISRRNLIIGGLVALTSIGVVGVLVRRNERRADSQNCEISVSNDKNTENYEEMPDPKMIGEAKPLYRIYNSLNGNNFYTMSSDERDLATQVIGKDRGVEGLMFDLQKDGTLPFFRLEKQVKGGTQYTAVRFYSFYTANENEKRRAVEQGWKEKGITGWIFSKRERGTVPLYRLRTIGKLMYLYTTDADEVRDFVKNSWWEYKGIAGYLYPAKEDLLQKNYEEFDDSKTIDLDF